MALEAKLIFCICILAFFFGSCLFSFLNVIVYRVPKKLSFIKGRSQCPSCGHALSVPDLVPIFSYMFLKGKCRFCEEKIGVRDTLVEAMGGILAVLCVFSYQENPLAGVTAFLFFAELMVVSLFDFDTMEIPNSCHIVILVLAVVSFFTMQDAAFDSIGKQLLFRAIGAVCVSVPMLILALVIPGAFGGGDIKLMAACGLFMGWRLILVSAALGILLGGAYGVYLLAAKKKGRKEHFAFGPFLCAGMVLGLLFGDILIYWYIGTFF